MVRSTEGFVFSKWIPNILVPMKVTQLLLSSARPTRWNQKRMSKQRQWKGMRTPLKCIACDLSVVIIESGHISTRLKVKTQ